MEPVERSRIVVAIQFIPLHPLVRLMRLLILRRHRALHLLDQVQARRRLADRALVLARRLPVFQAPVRRRHLAVGQVQVHLAALALRALSLLRAHRHLVHQAHRVGLQVRLQVRHAAQAHRVHVLRRAHLVAAHRAHHAGRAQVAHLAAVRVVHRLALRVVLLVPVQIIQALALLHLVVGRALPAVRHLAAGRVPRLVLRVVRRRALMDGRIGQVIRIPG